MNNERRRPPPDTLEAILDQLPAVVLLNRISIPILAVTDKGIIMFANPACQHLLGDTDTTVTGTQLNQFLPAYATAEQAVTSLRSAAGKIITFHHARNDIVQLVVSAPLLMRANDPILLVGLTDVTEPLWTAGPEQSSEF